jgi:hypothetical protein
LTYRSHSRRDRVFREQSGDHYRIQICATLHDHFVFEVHDPAVIIVEAHRVLRRG